MLFRLTFSSNTDINLAHTDYLGRDSWGIMGGNIGLRLFRHFAEDVLHVAPSKRITFTSHMLVSYVCHKSSANGGSKSDSKEDILEFGPN